jgi:hypothetical protein
MSRFTGNGLDDCRVGGVCADMAQKANLDMRVLCSRISDKLRQIANDVIARVDKERQYVDELGTSCNGLSNRFTQRRAIDLEKSVTHIASGRCGNAECEGCDLVGCRRMTASVRQ